MELVVQFGAEIDSLCVSLERELSKPDSKLIPTLCNQLWSIVYRAYSPEEKRRLCSSLNAELCATCDHSRKLAQSVEFELELDWAKRLLNREIPLSVTFLAKNNPSPEAKIKAFVSLLHGYPLAWALPRYKAELTLLDELHSINKPMHVAVIGSSAIPFTGFYFSALRGLRVSYLDPFKESFELGRKFIARLEELGLLEPAMVCNFFLESEGDLPRISETIGKIDAVFIVDQKHQHKKWLEKIESLDISLVFCQDALELAALLYQPLNRHELPKSFKVIGETIPAHAATSESRQVRTVPIESSDVFITTVALGRNHSASR